MVDTFAHVYHRYKLFNRNKIVFLKNDTLAKNRGQNPAKHMYCRIIKYVHINLLHIDAQIEFFGGNNFLHLYTSTRNKSR